MTTGRTLLIAIALALACPAAAEEPVTAGALPARLLVRSGKLDVQLLYAEMPGGPLRVSGMIEARGKKDAGDTAATAAAFLALPFLPTGRSAEIAAGAEVSGRLDRDLWIDRR
ncbi:hypothetical protein ASE06_09330 [Sphingopyxis sp. Root214]|uniref:hypothetical protein n=1 Tax=unclassified Sphingopyxis TaxID=2614943 RepID=UPI0006FC9A94|nr:MULTISPECIES: hypothetical protein [unclassified Sphingopyxis]KQZ72680.1 hypothetical protein ASD73_06975 [Sphingopyxis sp. Root154]KRC06827.1 hypothetical protein ASE06_09330 [Sphingopyxis sp. Root214]